MPDPKLKMAMEEIKLVLAQHDIAGVLILSSKTHTEYLHELTPSWSCLRIHQLPDGDYVVRVRIKRADFATVEEYRAAAKETVGLIAGLADTLAGSERMLRAVLGEVGKRIEFSHWTKHEKP